MSERHWHLQLLGLPALHVPAGKSVPLSRTDAALLAVLAIDGVTSREELAALLWPGARSVARGNLRQRLLRWRTRLGLVLDEAGLTLGLPPGLTHDLQDLPQRLLRDASAGSGRLLGHHAYDDKPLLAQWVARARAHWHSERLAALGDQADACERGHRWSEALVLAERIVADDALLEHAHRRLMRLHYLRGDRAAALAAWRRCAAVLAAELAVKPDRDTRELAQLIESSGVAAPPARAPTGGSAAVAIAMRAPLPMALLRPPRLIGRSAAWAALLDAWQLRQTVVLAGDPGIGKTRLLSDFAQAVDGMTVHGAHAGDAALPYSVLQRLLPTVLARASPPVEPWAMAEFARLLPDLGRAAPGRLEPLRLQRALSHALQAASRHGLPALALDDVQHADDASLDLLLHVWAQPASALPRLVLTVRAGEQPARLADWCAARPAGAVAALQLPPLDGAAVAAFVDALALPGVSAARWAPALAQRTGGNPLFMLQVLAAAHAEGADDAAAVAAPADVSQLIERRLQRLSAPALRLARIAALAGDTFTLPLAADVLKQHVIDLADALDELQEARLMLGTRLTYDLLAEALLRTIPADVARLLHGQLAESLQRAGTAPAVVAEHHARAGQWGAAAERLDAAALAARAASARRDEMMLCDKAAHAYGQAGDSTRAWDAAERALTAAHRVESIEQLEQRAAALLDAARNALQRLAALLHMARMHITSDATRALDDTRQALALTAFAGTSAMRLSTTAWHGLALAMLGQRSEGLAVLQSAQAQANVEADPRARLDYFGNLGHALHVAGHYADAIVAVRTAAQLASDLGELVDVAEQTGNLAVCCNTVGDLDGERLAVDRVLAAWRQMGEPHGAVHDTMLVQACTTLTGAGRYDEALALLPAAAERLAKGAPHWGEIAGFRLAWLYIGLGQPARARRSLRPLPADATAGALAAHAIIEARLRRLAGKPALGLLRTAWNRWHASLDRLDRLSLQLALAEATDDAQDSVALCNAVLDNAGPDDAAPAWRHALLRRAQRNIEFERLSDAGHDLRLACQTGVRATVAGLSTIERCLLIAQVADRVGESAIAATALTEGLAWLAAALPHVPPELVEGFLHRNPAVRGLRALAAAV